MKSFHATNSFSDVASLNEPTQHIPLAADLSFIHHPAYEENDMSSIYFFLPP